MASEVKSSANIASFSTDLQKLLGILQQSFMDGKIVVYCAAHHMTQGCLDSTDLSALVKCSPAMIEVAKKIFIDLKKAASYGRTSTKFSFDNFLVTSAVLNVFQTQMSLTGYNFGISPRVHSDFCPLIHASRRLTITISWELTNPYLGHKPQLQAPSRDLTLNQEREDYPEETDKIAAQWLKMDLRQKIAYVRKSMQEADLSLLQQIEQISYNTSSAEDDPAVDTFLDVSLELQHRITQLKTLHDFSTIFLG